MAQVYVLFPISNQDSNICLLPLESQVIPMQIHSDSLPISVHKLELNFSFGKDTSSRPRVVSCVYKARLSSTAHSFFQWIPCSLPWVDYYIQLYLVRSRWRGYLQISLLINRWKFTKSLLSALLQRGITVISAILGSHFQEVTENRNPKVTCVHLASLFEGDSVETLWAIQKKNSKRKMLATWEKLILLDVGIFNCQVP
jgi:hypothetical protein